MSPSNLTESLAAAWRAREALIERLANENTTAYRLLHGSVEGQPGLTVDRYGAAVLVQSFHRSLQAAELEDIRTFLAGQLPQVPVHYNDRSEANSRVAAATQGEAGDSASAPRTFAEIGVQYHYQARHAGQDPWLFLDLRAGRRRIMSLAGGRSVLNVFAYTCGVGVAALKAGAKSVLNVDFAASGLEIGRANAALNSQGNAISFVQCDAFAALRQLADLGQPQRVRGVRLPTFARLAPQTFDLVVLDPPRYSRSPFGVVDVVVDYAAIFKPALLATAPGGFLLCTHHVPSVTRATWLDQLQRCARKVGRPLLDHAWIDPEADFPSLDGEFALKMLLVRV